MLIFGGGVMLKFFGEKWVFQIRVLGWKTEAPFRSSQEELLKSIQVFLLGVAFPQCVLSNSKS
jgi:hypothetical protein